MEFTRYNRPLPRLFVGCHRKVGHHILIVVAEESRHKQLVKLEKPSPRGIRNHIARVIVERHARTHCHKILLCRANKPYHIIVQVGHLDILEVCHRTYIRIVKHTPKETRLCLKLDARIIPLIVVDIAGIVAHTPYLRRESVEIDRIVQLVAFAWKHIVAPHAERHHSRRGHIGEYRHV